MIIIMITYTSSLKTLNTEHHQHVWHKDSFQDTDKTCLADMFVYEIITVNLLSTQCILGVNSSFLRIINLLTRRDVVWCHFRVWFNRDTLKRLPSTQILLDKHSLIIFLYNNRSYTNADDITTSITIDVLKFDTKNLKQIVFNDICALLKVIRYTFVFVEGNVCRCRLSSRHFWCKCLLMVWFSQNMTFVCV